MKIKLDHYDYSVDVKPNQQLEFTLKNLDLEINFEIALSQLIIISGDAMKLTNQKQMEMLAAMAQQDKI